MLIEDQENRPDSKYLIKLIDKLENSINYETITYKVKKNYFIKILIKSILKRICVKEMKNFC